MSHGSLEPRTITKLAYGAFDSFALLAGMKLELFTHLSPEGATAAELAAALETRERMLHPLLDLLVATGMVERNGERFCNGPEAEAFLVKGRPGYRGGLAPFYERLWMVALRTAESIRAGAPSEKLDFAQLDQDGLLAFFRRQYPSSLMGGQELADYIHTERYQSVADVGGGTGGTSIGLCMSAAHMRSTVYELASVAPITRTFVAEAGLEDRIDVCVLDADPGQGSDAHDLAVVRSVLQVLDEGTARTVVANAFRLLRPGGALLIVGSVLRDTRDGPAPSLARGLVFLNAYESGQSYTEAEHRSWLSDAGFVDIEVDYECMRDGTSAVRARRP